MIKYKGFVPIGDADYGARFNRWLMTDNREPYNSFGNGSTMCVSPCAWRMDATTDELPFEGKRLAQLSANDNTIDCKRCIKEYLEKEYRYNFSQSLDEIRPNYRFNETCQDTVPQAIIAFLESTDFEDAIRNAISIGGDSDTLAAITGSIAEAAYGIPERIKDKAYSYLDEALKDVLRRWEETIVIK